jgi:hypothetical protein
MTKGSHEGVAPSTQFSCCGPFSIARNFKRTWTQFPSHASFSKWEKKAFKRREQTVIVLDWDDTLFPTTFVNEAGGLSFHRKNSAKLQEMVEALQKCDNHAVALLQEVHELGYVLIVTLSKQPWVEVSAETYFPKVARLLKSRQVRVVYASEFQKDLEKMPVPLSPDAPITKELVEAQERYWGRVKGRAIEHAVERFYGSHCWKNLLSFGDSMFDRYGMLSASCKYVRETFMPDVQDPGHTVANGRCPALDGVRNGRFFRVRTKVLKLIDNPSPDDLAMELALLLGWLPPMVAMGCGFDLKLSDLSNESLEVIDRVLTDSTSTLDGSNPDESPVSPSPSYSTDITSTLDGSNQDESPVLPSPSYSNADDSNVVPFPQPAEVNDPGLRQIRMWSL